MADGLSRVALDDHITTNPEVIYLLEQAFEKITIDRFATDTNKVCERYNSFYLESSAWGVDAFAQRDYDINVNFLFPPISLVGRTM